VACDLADLVVYDLVRPVGLGRRALSARLALGRLREVGKDPGDPERGDPSGALPGWEWTAQSWRSGDQIVIRVAFGAWDVLVRLPGAPVEILRVTTAREGMRLFKAQGLGGAFVFVATKNVMSPGKDFAASSAPRTISRGAKSPPMASTAICIMNPRPYGRGYKDLNSYALK